MNRYPDRVERQLDQRIPYRVHSSAWPVPWTVECEVETARSLRSDERCAHFDDEEAA